MSDGISKIVKEVVEENENIRTTSRAMIKKMILEGDIQLKEVERDVYSNEGFNYGPEKLYILTVDGEEQDYNDGISIERPEITGW